MKRTMKDLAEELGLSRTTVSIVLKGKADQYRISQETREKILNLVEKEDYKPNFFAKGLNRGRTNTVAVIFPDIFEEFMVEMVRGISGILEKADHTMILMTSGFNPEKEKRNMEELKYRGIDGILLVPSCGYRGDLEDRVHLRRAEKEGTAIVLIDRVPKDWTGSQVVQDDFQGGVLAAGFLKSKECGMTVVISLDLTASSIKARLKGFDSACDEYEKIYLREQNGSSLDLTEALNRLTGKRKNSSPLGFFVTTAGLAMRVKDIMEKMKYTLNRDFFIIRFGDDPRGYRSGLKCISQPHYQMGVEAASVLLGQMENGSKERRCLPVALQAGSVQ